MADPTITILTINIHQKTDKFTLFIVVFIKKINLYQDLFKNSTLAKLHFSYHSLQNPILIPSLHP